MTGPFQPPAGNKTHEVAPFELFFDLVFVFAVSQLSHHLLHHLSWRGTAETVVMLVAVFEIWSFTSWSAAIAHVDRSRTRWMVLAVMLPGLFMNAALTGAFTTNAWPFVVPLLLIQLGRTFWSFATAPDALFRDHFFRMLLWVFATAPLWLAGAAANPNDRLLWWAVAAAIDLAGLLMAHPIPSRKLESENIGFDGGHMLKRARLFLLIALGETMLTTGAAIASAPMTIMTLVTGTAALAGTVALWALAFTRADSLFHRYVEESHDPIRAGRRSVDTLLMLFMGLLAIAVGNGTVIAHPDAPPSAALSLLLFGGPILFLLSQEWSLRTILGSRARTRLTGSAALAALGFATAAAPPYVALVSATATLALMAFIELKAAEPSG